VRLVRADGAARTERKLRRDDARRGRQDGGPVASAARTRACARARHMRRDRRRDRPRVGIAAAARRPFRREAVCSAGAPGNAITTTPPALPGIICGENRAAAGRGAGKPSDGRCGSGESVAARKEACGLMRQTTLAGGRRRRTASSEARAAQRRRRPRGLARRPRCCGSRGLKTPPGAPNLRNRPQYRTELPFPLDIGARFAA
jgi:hypothetical protein